MTREEAIKVLRTIIDNSVEMTIREWEEFDKQVLKAIDMAIEALSEPTCKKCTDLIRREDAIDAVWKLDKEATEYVVDDTHEIHGYCTAIGVCVGELSALPSVDAAPVDRTSEWVAVKREEYENYLADRPKGEWKEMEILCNPYPPVFCVECSECGYRVGRETYLENTFNFCPNCGADMRKGE